MVYIACDGTLSTGAGGEVLCSGAWVEVVQPEFAISELDSAAIASLLAAALVTFCLAYGFRVIRKQMGF